MNYLVYIIFVYLYKDIPKQRVYSYLRSHFTNGFIDVMQLSESNRILKCEVFNLEMD